MNVPLDTTLPRERQQRILERLHREGRVVATDLAQEFRVSEDSIRRDLRDLASQGLCRRVYGGALLVQHVAPLGERHHERAELKRALAQVAAELVGEGQILFIGAGSTNTALAKALPDHRKSLNAAISEMRRRCRQKGRRTLGREKSLTAVAKAQGRSARGRAIPGNVSLILQAEVETNEPLRSRRHFGC